MPYLRRVRLVVVVAVGVVEFVCAVDLSELGTNSGKIFRELDNHSHRHSDAKQIHRCFDAGCFGMIAKSLETLVFCCLVARHLHPPTSVHCSFEQLQIEPRSFVVVVAADDGVVAVEAEVMIHVNRIDLAGVSWDHVPGEITGNHHSQVDGLCTIDGIDIDWDDPWDNVVVVAADNDCYGYCCMCCNLNCNHSH